MPSVVTLGETPTPSASTKSTAPKPACINYRCAYNKRAKRWVKVCTVPRDAKYRSGTMILPDRAGDCLPKHETTTNGSGKRR